MHDFFPDGKFLSTIPPELVVVHGAAIQADRLEHISDICQLRIHQSVEKSLPTFVKLYKNEQGQLFSHEFLGVF